MDMTNASEFKAMFLNAMINKLFDNNEIDFVKNDLASHLRIVLLKCINETEDQSDPIARVAVYKYITRVLSELADDFNNLYFTKLMEYVGDK